MPTFQAVSDDEQRMSTYILQRCPPELKADLDSYMCTLLSTHERWGRWPSDRRLRRP